MATSFSELRKSRTKDLEKLTTEVSKLTSKEEKKSYEDLRFWKPTVDKAGNGMATIRFLPAPEGEDMPWVQIFSHSFQGPTGQWYIENSLTTLNKKDPVSEYNTLLWNSGIESDKEVARKQKRKLNYISNVYIVRDSANPDNEGKVFLFKYGKKIFDKLNDLMNPQFEDESPINPFDLWEGANFKLKIRKVEGYQNYDKSEFDSPSALSEDDDELERIWKAEHNLKEFLDEKNFKAYDVLKAKLNTVLNLNEAVEAPVKAKQQQVEKEAPKASKNAESSKPWVDDDNDDEAMSYFEKLAQD